MRDDRSLPGLIPVSLTLLGMLLAVLPAHSQGQDGGSAGGHSPGREAQAEERLRAVFPHAARVRTGVLAPRQAELLEERMGFRPKPGPAPKPVPPAAEPVRAEARAEPKPEPVRETPPPIVRSPEAIRELRLGGAAFKRAEYDEATARFKAAAEASPEDPGALFALGQALVAEGKDARAARTIRMSVRLRPEILRAPHDIERAYRDFAEFDRVMKALEVRAAATPSSTDAKFVLAFQRYLTGDARCRETFEWFRRAVPEDAVAAELVKAANLRFGPREKVRDAPVEENVDPARSVRNPTR